MWNTFGWITKQGRDWLAMRDILASQERTWLTNKDNLASPEGE